MYYPQFYDPQFNLLYVFVAPLGEEKKSILSRMSSSSSSDTGYTNVVLWDIPKKAKKNLFSSQELSKDEHITAILFETGYNAEKNERIFNDNAYVFNNRPLTPREAVNKMLVATQNRSNKTTTLWFGDKFGNNKFKIATFSETASWHLDVHNGDIRIIEPLNTDIKVLELRWYL